MSQPLIGVWTCPTSCASLKMQFSCGEVRLRIPGRTRAVYSEVLEINPTHPKACEWLAALNAEEKGEKPSALIPRLFGQKN